MAITRHSHDDDAGIGTPSGDGGRARTDVRKRIALRTAVTMAATGLALAVPMSSQAGASLSPAALKSLHLDSATLKKVKKYDRYRTRQAGQRKRAKKALRFARKQIGKPYRWGAEGPSSYDCSGLAMAAWRRAGVSIPRVTHAQYRKVKRKVKLKDLKRGDLIFFHGRRHVGIYVGHGKFLHAPHSGAKVRIDKLSSWRKRQFAGAVRPGAPAYKKWAPSIQELAEKIDGMSAQKRAVMKPPDKQRTPDNPHSSDTTPKKSDNPPLHAPGHTPAKQAAPPGDAASMPDDSAAQAPRSDTRSDKKKPESRPRHEPKHKSKHGSKHKADHLAEHKADHKADHETERETERETRHKADHETERETEHAMPRQERRRRPAEKDAGMRPWVEYVGISPSDALKAWGYTAH